MHTACAEEQIGISFPVVQTQEAEPAELERYFKRPGNFWCVPAGFDVKGTFRLTEQIQSGDLNVRSSAVTVKFQDEEHMQYRGSYSRVGESERVAEWAGSLEGENDFKGHFSVQPKINRADAILDTE